MKLTVSVVQDELIDQLVFRVELFRPSRPDYSVVQDINPQDPGIYSYDDVARRVEAAGGALAEYLIGNYGEALEPSRCAAVALRVYREMLPKLVEAKVPMPRF